MTFPAFNFLVFATQGIVGIPIMGKMNLLPLDICVTAFALSTELAFVVIILAVAGKTGLWCFFEVVILVTGLALDALVASA